jgi:phosphopentomutase
MLPYLRDDDLLIITADHGNDPKFKGTDHTRERVPLVIYNKNMRNGIELQERMTFANIGATIVDNFNVSKRNHQIGDSMLDEIKEAIK